MIAAVITLVAALAMAGAGWAVYRKFFAPIREWDASTPYRFTTKSYDAPSPEEPFYSWWNGNNAGMGREASFDLTDALKRKIDLLSLDMQTWVYKRDQPDVDFEPVTIDQMAGDCEDFARVFALRLIDMGIPAGALTLGLGFHPRIGWHCILLMLTDQGGYMAEVGNALFRPWNTNGFLAGQGGPVHGLMAPKVDGFYYDIEAA